jgi:hypothetical protein
MFVAASGLPDYGNILALCSKSIRPDKAQSKLQQPFPIALMGCLIEDFLDQNNNSMRFA